MTGTAAVLLPYLQTFLAIGNVCVMLYALKTFLTKPQTTLEEKHLALEKRIDAHDTEIKDIKKSLDTTREKYKDQKDLNTVFINCMLAFIDFGMSCCAQNDNSDCEGLEEAKKALQDYLAKR